MTYARAGWGWAAAAGAVFGAPAWAQAQTANPQSDGARRVQSGTEDAYPLLLSNPPPVIDMRSQTSFETVYTFQATDPMARNNGYFFRVAGAITAVFPRSVYMESRDGVQADIPPGTVFYIGGLPPWLRPEEKHAEETEAPYNALDMSATDGAIDRSFGPGAAPPAPVRAAEQGRPVPDPGRAGGRGGAEVTPARPSSPASHPGGTPAADAASSIQVSIWTNEEYRQHQVAALIKAAAAARAGRTGATAERTGVAEDRP